MNVQFVGKNITLRDNTKHDIEKRLERLDKYFNSDADAIVTLSLEGALRRAEITINAGRHQMIFRADQSSPDLLLSTDQCIDALVSQIRTHKSKLRRSKRSKASIRYENIEAFLDEAEVPEDQQLSADIARTKHLELKPMSPDEAALQLELINHDFYVFINDATSQVNVIYRRRVGNYGLLIPEREK